MLLSEKINFKTKIVIKTKESHYVLISESIYKDIYIFINTHAPNIGAPKYIYKY